MPDRYDAIILRGDHTGLAGGAFLARAGTVHLRALRCPHGLRLRA
jgi:hypothetical protein